MTPKSSSKKRGDGIRVRRNRDNWILYILLALLMINIASAEVVVFKSYETNSRLEKGSLHINREIVLQNVGSNPIIPGELHFKLHEIRKGQKIASEVNNLGAVNDYGKDLKSRQVESREETDLVVSVWEPVLPKFTYNVILDYDLKFDAKGVLFYEIKVPLEETTIPIQSQKQSLYLPAKYHVTYAPGADVQFVEEQGNKYRVVSWQDREDMVVEYSVIPLPRMGIRAVNVFWVVMIIALLIATFLIHRKLRSA